MTLTVLAWRRQRGAILTAVAVAVLYAGVAVAQSPALSRLIWSAGVFAHPAVVLPIGFGACWAAPLLAREQQQRTVDLAFTQSVSRVRWVLTWITPVVVAAPVLSLAVYFAFYLYQADGETWSLGFWVRMEDLPSQIGLVVLSVALGLCAGAVLGRTLPAVAVTIVGTLAAPYVLRIVTVFLYPQARTYAGSAIVSVYVAVAALLGVTVWWMTRKAPRS